MLIRKKGQNLRLPVHPGLSSQIMISRSLFCRSWPLWKYLHCLNLGFIKLSSLAWFKVHFGFFRKSTSAYWLSKALRQSHKFVPQSLHFLILKIPWNRTKSDTSRNRIQSLPQIRCDFRFQRENSWVETSSWFSHLSDLLYRENSRFEISGFSFQTTECVRIFQTPRSDISVIFSEFRFCLSSTQDKQKQSTISKFLIKVSLRNRGF